MNTKEALEKSIVMWDWLTTHPGKTKPDALAVCFPNEPSILHNCFLCELVNDAWKANCTECPVWPAKNDRDFHGCEAYGSPYKKWWDDHSNTNAAQEVANLCRLALEKYNES